MFHVVLYQPEIPPNTGNIIRLCANTGCELHLIEPLGFSMDDGRLRRAGLDYNDLARVHRHANMEAFLHAVAPRRLFAYSTQHSRRHSDCRFAAGDALLFGPETRGLPPDICTLALPAHRVGLPMVPGNRSLNLSNTVAVAVYEAWRQLGFTDSA
jgi:tRNA (cytidine/uridine-2'-O-)-methyltransferase